MTIEFQNLISDLPKKDEVYVIRYYPYPFSENIKVPPINTRYYILSRKKLTSDECLLSINEYLKKVEEDASTERV